jgi:hypothetical protein
MKRLSRGLLIPVALLLGSGEARADATAKKTSIELFGKTLCLSDAPADTHCDWRIPAGKQRPQSTPPLQRGSDSGHQATPARPRLFDLFGLHVCFGDVEATTHCDVQYPRKETADRQARL